MKSIFFSPIVAMLPFPEGSVKCVVFLKLLKIRIAVNFKQLLAVHFKQLLLNGIVVLSGKKLSQYQAGTSNGNSC